MDDPQTDVGMALPASERIYKLTPDQYEAALDRLAKLQAAARKLGVTPVALVKIDEILVPYRKLDADGKPEGPEFLRLEFVCLLTGTTPKLPTADGSEPWEFVGTVQHEETGNVIKLAPVAQGRLDTTAYRLVHQKCDHCGYYRNRRDTYLLAQGYEANGNVMQVGSSCIKDFLGHGDPEQLLSYVQNMLDFIGDVDTDERTHQADSNPRKDYFDTIEFLTHTACMVRLHGWISKAKAIDADQEATVARVWHNIHQFEERNKLYNDYEPPTPQDKLTAQAAHEWLRETFAAKPVADRNEFEHNLITAAYGTTFEIRLGGFVAYVVEAYRKATAEAIERTLTKRLNKHIGTPGDKLTLKGLKVFRVFSYPNNFDGVTHKHIFNDRHGNTYTWSTSSTELPQGATFDVTATIKEHTEYKGTNQTVLTRCKCVMRITEGGEVVEQPTGVSVNLAAVRGKR